MEDNTTVEPTEQQATEVEGQQTASEQQTSPQTQEEGKPADKPKDEPVPKWAQRRFDELTRKRYEAEAKAKLYEEELARYRTKEPGDEDRQQPAEKVDPKELYAQAEKAAAFNLKCNSVYEQGTKEIPDFDKAVTNLRMVGGLSQEALEVIVDAEAPAKVLAHLGSNLEEAASILSLPPVQMARAIGRLEARLATQTPPVSKAPDPIKPVNTSRAVSSSDPSDKDDIDTWMKKEQERLRARFKR